MSAVAAWTVAQLTKLLRDFFRGDFRWERLTGAGGMPSSHTSFVVSMATQVGLVSGFNSTNFGLAACFCMIVMYDAAGVRHAVGRQAQMLNLLIDEYNEVDINKVKEILGHTPMQVVAGIFLGLLVGIVGYYKFY